MPKKQDKRPSKWSSGGATQGEPSRQIGMVQ